MCDGSALPRTLADNLIVPFLVTHQAPHNHLRINIPKIALAFALLFLLNPNQLLSDELGKAGQAQPGMGTKIGNPNGPSARSLYVKILLNIAPARTGEITLPEEELRGILNILVGVSRQPYVSRFSVVAFSTGQQRVLYREAHGHENDFSTLRQAIQTLHPGTIDISQIADPQSSNRFLIDFMSDELGPGPERPDAIVVISPKVVSAGKFSLKGLSVPSDRVPVFFLNYTPDRLEFPWTEAIGSVMKACHAVVYTISGPRDLDLALERMSSALASGGSTSN